ncbi:class I SAM-dependent methyltransferase [Streptomyces sp. NPDC006879]|uniref:class I SAM-dependent methyltransferase n=1 Tax=Streptomyces sp. NPDC006879 TaxID=3364767 RepID=UPI00368B57BD
MVDSTAAETNEEFWEARYAGSTCVWSGNPNPALVRETADLTPGRALDLGCGEGGDAIWLARQGWQVTATDISRTALTRAAAHAAEAGVADRIDWQHHDLARSFPEGSFDLVCAQFLHSRADDMPREQILRSAAATVGPKGTLLIVGHGGVRVWEHAPEGVRLPAPQEVLGALDLPEERWEMLVCEEYEVETPGPEGEPVKRTDNTVKARRRA